MVRTYDSELWVTLSNAHSRKCILVERSHIPTAEAAEVASLKKIVHYIDQLKVYKVGLVIGHDYSRSLAPRNYIIGKDKQAFGVETDLD